MKYILTAIVLIVVSCVLIIGLRTFVEIPVAVICDRDKPNVEVHLSSTAIGGYFKVHRIGPCVTYTHESRAVED